MTFDEDEAPSAMIPIKHNWLGRPVKFMIVTNKNVYTCDGETLELLVCQTFVNPYEGMSNVRN